MEIFNEFYLRRTPAYRQEWKLILAGSVRNDEDRDYVEQLQLLIDNLHMKNDVELKVNVNSKELKSILHQGMIGLQSMKNEDFGIGLIDSLPLALQSMNLYFQILSK